MLFSFFDPLQKRRHLHFLARTASDDFVFGLYFLQSLLEQGLSMLLSLNGLHGNRPIHSFPLLLGLLIYLLKSRLTRALVKYSFLRRHILRALRCQSIFAGVLKTHSILVLLLRCVSAVE